MPRGSTGPRRGYSLGSRYGLWYRHTSDDLHVPRVSPGTGFNRENGVDVGTGLASWLSHVPSWGLVLKLLMWTPRLFDFRRKQGPEPCIFYSEPRKHREPQRQPRYYCGKYYCRRDCGHPASSGCCTDPRWLVCGRRDHPGAS